MTTRIPMLDLTLEIELLWDELQHATARVLRSGRFILGPEVEAFEREVAHTLGVRHAIGVASGTDALMIGLRALGIGPGDEVITTPFTFVATAEAIRNVGAVPRFIDIHPCSWNLDAEQIGPAVTGRTKALLPVHLFGLAAEMDAICDAARQYGLRILEDTAQAFGGRYKGRLLGTIGDAGAFSFFPSKNLGGFGDGGLIATNDDEVAETARLLRAHGSRRKGRYELVGYNSRLDELQAALLRVKLPHVDRWNDARKAIAARYGELLADVAHLQLPAAPSYVDHVYHQYTIQVRGRDRDELHDKLEQAGIATMVYYAHPVHTLPVYAQGQTRQLPNAEEASQEVLSLPMGPMMTREQVTRVAQALRRNL